MLLTILTLVIFLLNFSFVAIHLQDKMDKMFHKSLLMILLLGSLHRFFIYISFWFYPNSTYILLSLPLCLLYGPALLLLSKYKNDIPISRGFMYHLIPFALMSAVYIFILNDPSIRYSYHQAFIIILYFIASVQIAYYLMGFSNNTNVAKDFKNDMFSLKAIIQKGAIIGVFILQLVLVSSVVEDGNNINLYRGIDQFLYFLFTVGVFLLFDDSKIRSIVSALFFTRKHKPDFVFDSPVFSKSYIGSKVVHSVKNFDNTEENYFNRIESFRKSLGFLDIDLNKEKFAQAVNIPIDSISPLLLQTYGVGYTGFINNLRLEHSANLLRREDLVYTIEELSLICGFNSRASFYRNFQKAYGCSPHEFRKNELADI